MMRRLAVCLVFISSCLLGGMKNAIAAPLSISDSPLFLSQSVPSLMLIVLERDHRLFYPMYNDMSDINGDGVIDTRFNPALDYYGYFDPYKCYTYSSSSGQFNPASLTSTKTCSGQWSGNFLNYLTMSRMDVIRKALYGGKRSTDSNSTTVLERTYIPQDSHSWGKEYTSVANDGYDITLYTPFSIPTSGNHHLFANTTPLGTTNPLLRVLTNQPYHIWDWLSINQPVAGTHLVDGVTGPTVTPTDYIVRVKVCDSSIGLGDNCRLYGSNNFKPIGLLQQFGENNQIKFGLLTGSYSKNLSGGVLRKNIGTFTDEINLNSGIFTSINGIVKTINNIKITNFGTGYTYNPNCGFIWNRSIQEGECDVWGNPIAEMMYEGLRYFAGKTSPTSAYDYGSSSGDDATLGLPKPSWQNVYDPANNQYCAKPNLLVISDAYPSYDSDQIPGNAFSSFSGDLSPAMDANSLAQTIGSNEISASSSHFIGQVGSLYDAAPTPKTMSNFGNIRGLAPDLPTKQGSYYSASAAYYGWLNDINSVQGTQQVQSFIMSLDSTTPTINISVNGQTIKLIPFAKSVSGCSSAIDPTQDQFQPTDTMLNFYVESLTPTSGVFRVNFDDAEQGGDQEMDAFVQYSYIVNPDNTVSITVQDLSGGSCIIQHIGYIISGTTADGLYLEVKDSDTTAGTDVDYYLDTPPGVSPGGIWNDSVDLPTVTTRTFTPSTTAAATFLNNPLWYAAKWGGFTDRNGNNIPDLSTEWDTDNNGIPDNYFLLTNVSQLTTQLSATFTNIVNRQTGASASAVANSGSLKTNSRLYIAMFNSGIWTGQVLSFPINPSTGQLITTGTATGGAEWDSGPIITAQNYNTGRDIITYKPSTGRGVAFRWPQNSSSPSSNEIDTSQVTSLNTNPITSRIDNLGSQRVNFLRGSSQNELANGGTFRNRTSTFGDVINASPVFVGAPNFAYSDNWGSGAAENSAPYSSFKSTYSNRTQTLYVGANDGMLHAINATTGAEMLGYIPYAVYTSLNQLTSTAYTHQFYVDASPITGDVFYDGAWHTVLVGGLNKGGQGIYALDITNPSSFSESNASNIALWEITSDTDPNIGYTFSQPNIARMANGQWVAIFGNGFTDVRSGRSAANLTNTAIIYIVDIKTGALVKKIDTSIGSNADPRALGRPNAITSTAIADINHDHITDYIYAGDLFGNLWKIDVTSSSVTNWGLAFNGSPLFTATDSSGQGQPITGQIAIGPLLTSSNKIQIYFGTGKFLESRDKTSTLVQSFYAITDDGSTPIASRSSLLQQTILSEQTVTKGSTTSTIRLTSNNNRASSNRGWYIDLIYNNNAAGERSITRPILRDNRIIFTTLIPSTDPCQFGGSSWLMELAAYDGRRLKDSPFDLNQDGEFTIDDKIAYGNNGNVIAASGLKSLSGIFSTPAILSAGSVEYKYLSSTSGTVQTVTENPALKEGRQSWRQLK